MDIIIPTLNCEKDLEKCLKSLSEQTMKVNVIVVDGRSKDGTIEVAQKYNAKIFIEVPNRPPPHKLFSNRALACQIGLNNSQSEIVAFLDADTVVPRDWALITSTCLKRLNDYKGKVAGVTTGCLPNKQNYTALAISGVLSSKLGGAGSAHAKQFDKLTEIKSAEGYNAVYLRKAIDEVGGFNLEIGGCEDWELNYRLRKKHWKIYGLPSVPVEHKGSTRFCDFSRQMMGYGYSRARLYKTTKIFSPIHALPSMALMGLFMLLILNFEFAMVVLLAYFSFIFLFCTTIPKGELLFTEFSKIHANSFAVFIIQHLSWSVGYIWGLMK